MKLAIASDHGGFQLKESLKNYLTNKYTVIDVGTFSEDSCNYPEFAIKCANLVADGTVNYGIIICTTGEGVMMVANKISGVRAGLAYNNQVAKLIREEIDANVITLGAKYTTLNNAKKMIDTFISTKFKKKYNDDVNMINDIERGIY